MNLDIERVEMKRCVNQNLPVSVMDTYEHTEDLDKPHSGIKKSEAKKTNTHKNSIFYIAIHLNGSAHFFWKTFSTTKNEIPDVWAIFMNSINEK